MRAARVLAAFVAAAVLAGPCASQAAAERAETLKTLLADRQCPRALYLQAIHERPAKVDGRARFLTITVQERPQSFVQCMFAQRDAVYCEASAFHDGPLSHKVPLAPDAVAVLRQLGFAATADGSNFSYRRAFHGEPDFDAIAILMLTVLHDAYGVRADTALETYAPFAGSLVTACKR